MNKELNVRKKIQNICEKYSKNNPAFKILDYIELLFIKGKYEYIRHTDSISILEDNTILDDLLETDLGLKKEHDDLVYNTVISYISTKFDGLIIYVSKDSNTVKDICIENYYKKEHTEELRKQIMDEGIKLSSVSSSEKAYFKVLTGLTFDKRKWGDYYKEIQKEHLNQYEKLNEIFKK